MSRSARSQSWLNTHIRYLCWERVSFRPPPNRKLNANKIEQLPRPRLSLLCPWQKRESLGSRLVSKLIAAVFAYHQIVICTLQFAGKPKQRSCGRRYKGSHTRAVKVSVQVHGLLLGISRVSEGGSRWVLWPPGPRGLTHMESFPLSHHVPHCAPRGYR